MDITIEHLMAFLLALLVLAVILILTNKQLMNSLNPMYDQTDKYTLCNKWLNNGCKILDSTYEEQLVDKGICEPCPRPTTTMDINEMERDMISRCGVDGGPWKKCLDTCNCLNVITLPTLTTTTS